MPPNIPPRATSPTDRRVDEIERRLTALEGLLDEKAVIDIMRELGAAKRDRAEMTDRIEALEREDRTIRRKVASLHDGDDDGLLTKTGSYRVENITRAAVESEISKAMLAQKNESLRVKLEEVQRQGVRTETRQDSREAIRWSTAAKVFLIAASMAASLVTGLVAKDCGSPPAAPTIAAPEQHSH